MDERDLVKELIEGFKERNKGLKKVRRNPDGEFPLSEADIAASRHMQRVLEGQRRCAAKLINFYVGPQGPPNDLYFAYAIN